MSDLSEADRAKMRNRYTELIRKKGVPNPVTEAKARALGVDVDAILAERQRIDFAARNHAIDFDLSLLDLGGDDWENDPVFTRWEEIRLAPGEAPSLLDLPGLGIYGEIGFLRQYDTALSSLLKAAIRKILAKLRDNPGEFRFTLPLGARDILLEHVSLGNGRWTVSGGLNPRARERVPSELAPTRSIDLLRMVEGARPFMAARPWPALQGVWLEADRWPDGRLGFRDAFETRADCPPERKANRPDQPDTVTLPFPTKEKIKWDHFAPAKKPATQFIRQYLCDAAGVKIGKTMPGAVEAVRFEYSVQLSVTDLRCGIRSGIHGPAPLASGMSWPICTNCGEIPCFLESLDFRDVSFGKLLPGCSLAIFLCDRCLEAGEGSEGTSLIWLPREGEIALVAGGSANPAVQARQWIDYEMGDFDELWEQFQARWPADFPSDFVFNPDPGSAVGGRPFYVQGDPEPLDASGLRMEYIAQFTLPEPLVFDGGAYLFHSATTGETVAEYQWG